MQAVEPSDTERSGWPETTREYVEELELIYSSVIPLIDEFRERAQYHHGKSGAYTEAFERLKERFK